MALLSPSILPPLFLPSLFHILPGNKSLVCDEQPLPRLQRAQTGIVRHIFSRSPPAGLPAVRLVVCAANSLFQNILRVNPCSSIFWRQVRIPCLINLKGIMDLGTSVSKKYEGGVSPNGHAWMVAHPAKVVRFRTRREICNRKSEIKKVSAPIMAGQLSQIAEAP